MDRTENEKDATRSRSRWIAGVASFCLIGTGCMAEREPGPSGPTDEGRASSHWLTLNTFITDYLQIDQLGAEPPDDANLFVGPDPADGSASVDKPPGPGPFIDWDDFAGDLANHQILDTDLPSGKDPSAFPRSNECVAAAQVLRKMDLRYAGAANNHEYAYFAVARSANNGDAAYYWLFTRKPPKFNAGEAPCKPTEERLLYDISGPNPATGSTGDVLLKGHFHPGAEALLEVYQATADMNDVDAVSAIDYTSGLWALHPAGVAAVAVNTTETAPGAFGSEGVISLTAAGNFEPEIFAESAVPISIFTGGSTCGASFFASVISRSSGSGGVTPDLKDLLGPAVVNFGNVTALASLTPTCTGEVLYQATATGVDGQPLLGATCTWTFDTGAQASGCSGSIVLPPGSRSAVVLVEDPGLPGCADTAAAAPVEVYEELSVQATCTATCELMMGYAATPSGGAGNYSIEWQFSGGGTVSPATSSLAAGFVIVGTGGVLYTGDVTLTETRGDLICTAEASCMATPYAPLAVSLSLTDEAGQCPGLLDDAVVYTALPSGGNMDYSYAWSGVACAGDQCEVSGDGQLCADKSFHVTLTDTSGLCPPADSETETYTKVTTINASDN